MRDQGLAITCNSSSYGGRGFRKRQERSVSASQRKQVLSCEIDRREEHARDAPLDEPLNKLPVFI